MSIHVPRDGEVAMSRGCSSPISGKRTEPAKTTLTPGVKEAFRRLWSSQGYENESDALRDLIETATFGRDVLVSLRDQQLRGLAVNWSGTGPAGGQGARS